MYTYLTCNIRDSTAWLRQQIACPASFLVLALPAGLATGINTVHAKGANQLYSQIKGTHCYIYHNDSGATRDSRSSATSGCKTTCSVPSCFLMPSDYHSIFIHCMPQKILDFDLGCCGAGRAGHIGVCTRSVAGQVSRVSQRLPFSGCVLAVLIGGAVATLHSIMRVNPGDSRANHIMCSIACGVGWGKQPVHCIIASLPGHIGSADSQPALHHGHQCCGLRHEMSYAALLGEVTGAVSAFHAAVAGSQFHPVVALASLHTDLKD